MASAHIEIIGGSRTSRQLRNVIDDTQRVANSLANLVAGVNQMVSGSDYASLARYLDLRIPEGEEDAGEPDAAKAEVVYNIIVDLNNLLNPSVPNAVTVALSRMY
jgi:hypothetical protein